MSTAAASSPPPLAHSAASSGGAAAPASGSSSIAPLPAEHLHLTDDTSCDGILWLMRMRHPSIGIVHSALLALERLVNAMVYYMLRAADLRSSPPASADAAMFVIPGVAPAGDGMISIGEEFAAKVVQRCRSDSVSNGTLQLPPAMVTRWLRSYAQLHPASTLPARLEVDLQIELARAAAVASASSPAAANQPARVRYRLLELRALAEYVLVEVLGVVVGRTQKDHHRRVIAVRDIEWAMKGDSEMEELARTVQAPFAGASTTKPPPSQVALQPQPVAAGSAGSGSTINSPAATVAAAAAASPFPGRFLPHAPPVFDQRTSYLQALTEDFAPKTRRTLEQLAARCWWNDEAKLQPCMQAYAGNALAAPAPDAKLSAVTGEADCKHTGASLASLLRSLGIRPLCWFGTERVKFVHGESCGYYSDGDEKANDVSYAALELLDSPTTGRSRLYVLERSERSTREDVDIPWLRVHEATDCDKKVVLDTPMDALEEPEKELRLTGPMLRFLVGLQAHADHTDAQQQQSSSSNVDTNSSSSTGQAQGVQGHAAAEPAAKRSKRDEAAATSSAGAASSPTYADAAAAAASTSSASSALPLSPAVMALCASLRTSYASPRARMLAETQEDKAIAALPPADRRLQPAHRLLLLQVYHALYALCYPKVWTVQLFTALQPPRLRAQFTAALLQHAWQQPAMSSMPYMPLELLELIGAYEPAVLPVLDGRDGPDDEVAKRRQRLLDSTLTEEEDADPVLHADGELPDEDEE